MHRRLFRLRNNNRHGICRGDYILLIYSMNKNLHRSS